ncbi:helix-turn-helix transcriptional regulator [Pyxidicoccus parkwayensis]|uniref:Helix-turn-helix transcriptional regulator n=1 Tax=Pyxidicoccus parkwayensis TaxID=2813578 RepID=A0ABX7NQK3_9BACT|nr:helix-turn-helix transcriptional regulator [Pyxidicoccus parkwaysis]QSQ21134.1 helix-turn-helix transcriptional regulator [Pyxidicoccus parkwaysis]
MDEELGATFGKALREARARRGLTQVEVAAMLDIHPMVYSRMERGRMLPRVSSLRKVAMVLRTSTDELLGLAREARPGAKKESPLLRRLMTLSEDLDEEKLKALVVMASALGR